MGERAVIPAFSNVQRRARLVARHHLGATAGDVVEAARSVVALHSSDPATPYLASRARVKGFTTGALDAALLAERVLWRLHAMRRTLFVVAADEAPVVEAAASRAVARRERARVEAWLGPELRSDDTAGFMAGLEQRVLEVLSDGVERRTQDLTAAVPDLATEITLGSGKWTTRAPLSSRLLFLMAMDGRIVRTRPAGSWRSSQYHWAETAAWFGKALAPLDPVAARVELARRYLQTHGPATVEDLRWWTGWSVRDTTAALKELETSTVRLDGGAEGLILGTDLLEDDLIPPHVTFLPALDPTPMGWKERAWLLGPHATALFDRNGNAGPTVWIDGRVVGGWAQLPDGNVVYSLLEEVAPGAAARVVEEAAALTEWFDGVVVTARFRTPLERSLAGG